MARVDVMTTKKVLAAARHWDAVYSSKRADAVSWFQAVPTVSLELLAVDGSLPASVVDVGGGESVLVDHLLARGVEHVTVVDVAEVALRHVESRMGHHPGLDTVAADVVSWQPSRTFRAWHDRAVLHFLVEDDDRESYVRLAAAAVEPGGIVVVGCFAPEGPEACSGLPVRRAGADELARLFAPRFTLVRARGELHITPGGAEQHFAWVVLRRG